MAYVSGNKLVGRDNRAAGSVAGPENPTNATEAPVPILEATYYGTAQSTTFTSSGTTATGTATGHGYSVGDVISVSGANEAGYNGHHIIATAPTSDTFTYNFLGSESPATGTIVSKKVLGAIGD